MERRKTSWPHWLAGTLLLLAVLYVGSFRVAVELHGREIVRSEALLNFYGPPARWCHRHCPLALRPAFYFAVGGELQWQVFSLSYALLHLDDDGYRCFPD